MPKCLSLLTKNLINRENEITKETSKRISIAEQYIDKIKKMECNFIYIGCQKGDRSRTFREIERVIFKK